MTDPTALLGLDVAALAEYLAASPGAPEATPPLSAAVVPGGLSNLTYELRDASGRAWLLRRPPLGDVPPPSGDVAREFRVVSALRGRVPVARPWVLCDDPAVIGVPFYVTDKPDGEVLRTREQFAALSEAEAHSRAEDLADVLAALHGVDTAVPGLEDPGAVDAWLHGQLDGWDRRYATAQSREIRGLFELAEGLRGAVPVTQRTVVLHGGFHLGTVCFDGSGVTAVLDWESAAIGDPLVDLGMLLAHWDDPVRGDRLLHPGFPSGRGIADRYAAATGLIVDDLDWYIALGHYKLAVTFEGVYHRYMRGLTAGDAETFLQAGAAVPALVELGRVHLDKMR